jgi:hypothetical protein
MNQSKPEETKRQPYAAPTVTVVNLAAKEVLAVGCKTPTTGNNSGASPCPAGGCAVPDAS